VSDEARRILEERERTHGQFSDVASLSQSIKDVLRRPVGWDAMPDHAREALDMMASKIARIVSGDHQFKDHWIDIVGYATLVVDSLPDT